MPHRARQQAELFVDRSLVLTKDDAIRRRPAERDALTEAAVRVFCLTNRHLRGVEQTERFVSNRHRILRQARKPGPYIWRLRARSEAALAVATRQRVRKRAALPDRGHTGAAQLAPAIRRRRGRPVPDPGRQRAVGEMAAAAGDGVLWVVGGGGVASQFADEGRLDEVHVTWSPSCWAPANRSSSADSRAGRCS